MPDFDGGGPLPETEARLEGVLAELVAREPIFHRPELGRSASDFDAQTAPDFWEVGASGRQYSRDDVRAVLEERYAESERDAWQTDGWRAEDFRCREVGPDTYLLTYTLFQGDRVTRRLTAWRRTPAGWQVLYHQGTVVTD